MIKKKFAARAQGTVIILYIQEKYSYAMCSIGILGFVVLSHCSLNRCCGCQSHLAVINRGNVKAKHVIDLIIYCYNIYITAGHGENG